MRPRFRLSLISLGLTTALLAGGPGGAAAGMDQRPRTLAVAAVQPGNAFLHVSTVDNVGGDTSYLDDLELNGQPGAKLFAINQKGSYGTSDFANDLPMGVWYNSGRAQWGIYNDDLSSMSRPVDWNVFIPPPADTVLVHTSNITNTSGDTTFVDDPQLNNHPEDILFVQHVYNPPGAPVNEFTPTVGLFYNNVRQKWGIFRIDDDPLPAGKSFFVLKAGPNDTVFQHVTSSANQLYGSNTRLDNPLIDGNPDALILVTQDSGAPPYHAGSPHRTGVTYDSASKHWLIFDEAGGLMPNGVQFNVLVIPPKQGAMLLTAHNPGANDIAIDNPDLNGNPYARLYVMHNWNPPESNNEKFNNDPIGVYYSPNVDQKWHLYNRDFNAITLGTTFNLYYTWPRGNSSIVSASLANSVTTYSMLVNSPALNGMAIADPIVSYNKWPNGLLGADYTAPVAVGYTPPDTPPYYWEVLGPSAPSLAARLSYNVLSTVGPDSFQVIATTGAGGNVFGNDLIIDQPLTNGDPWAMLFVSPVSTSPLNNGHHIGVYYTGTRWGIFNEDHLNITNGQVFDVFVVKRHPLFLASVQK